MLNGHVIKSVIIALSFLIGTGCVDQRPSSNASSAIAEVLGRENRFPDYPVTNTTYLSFSRAHGFQVIYLAPQGKAWLWYPGNRAGVPEEYRRDVVSGQQALCWRHPQNSFNPVTQQRGGSFACQSLQVSQRAIVSSLPGDPFSLRTGRVPYPLERCTAPSQFRFDRNAISC